MFKKTGLILLALTLTLAFLGCGGEICLCDDSPEVVFSLSEWLAPQSAGAIAGNLPRPLQKSGTATYSVSTDKTALVITGRGAGGDHHGAIDIKITAASEGLGLDLRHIYKITVTGQMNATGAANLKMKLAESDGPWDTLGDSGNLTGDNAPFNFSAIIPADYSLDTIRLQTENGSEKDFTITALTITKE